MNKRYLILMGLVLLATLYLGSCKYNTDIATPEAYERIYMPQAGDNPVTYHLTMADTAQTLIYGADYGGIDFPATDLSVHFSVEPTLVDSYNESHNTAYQLLPASSYELEATDATIPKGKTSTKPLALKVKTIGVLEHGVQYLLPLEISSSKDIQKSDGLGVTYFLVDAKYDIINVEMNDADKNPVSRILNMADTAQTLSFTAKATADDDLPSDIDVSFAAEQKLVDSFNLKNDTHYEKMPAGSFELVQRKGKIHAASGSTDPLEIKIMTKDFLTPFAEYLLPVRITEATGDLPVSSKIEISPSKATLYYLIQATKNGIELTVVSYGKGSGYNDMDALAASIKSYQPDLLLIRELDLNTTRSGPADQPKQLASLLGMPYYVFANALDYQGGEYGCAIYSKYPIDAAATKTFMLSSSKSEKGPLAITKVMVDGKYPLTFAGTHLNATGTIRNDMQVPELMDIMKQYSGPVILAGDFNAAPGNADDTYGVLTQEFTRPCQDCAPNFPASAPKTYSDYILYKSANDFSVLDYHVGQNAIGTHLPVVLKVKFYVD